MPVPTPSKAMLFSLLLACAPCAPGLAPTRAQSDAAARVAEKRAESPAAEVEVKAFPRRCSWINAPEDFKRLSDNSFSITASKQTDLYNPVDTSADVATAPMLVFPADDTFVLTTAVTVDFKQEFDGGFLIVYADSDHWVKLLFEKSHYGPFSVCSNVTNGDTDDTVNADVARNEVYLRVTRAKDVIGLYYSLDGTKWLYIRYFRFPVTGQLKVGFASQSPTGERCTTVFSNVSYSPSEVSDFWSGEPKATTKAK
jgi:regulation of enolase protein 1 (concanavalin A-like superfamily)